ncbi:hypothetical protein FRB96_008810 [Tulasnella sp. 330]|nr:hypothetical protein FRB96_008810 [Tulasnella sp. 330]
MTTYRRKNDLMSPDDQDYTSPSRATVFASAIATSQTQKNAQLRVRNGTNDPYAIGNSGGGTVSMTSMSDWSNGWKDEPAEDDDYNVWEAEASSSTSSSGRPPRPSIKTLMNGLTSSKSHPLSSPSPTSSWRRSHEDEFGLPDKSRRTTRRRTNSDGLNPHKAEGSHRGATRKGKGRMIDDEMEVIVHEILPTDSLAGVALKYGVELSDLRKANKLWSSDTIHLRKTLLIPLESRRFKSSAIDALIALEEESEVTSPATSQGDEDQRPKPEVFSSPQRTQSADPDESSGPNSLREIATIKRVPVSQLSFFPPSASSGAGAGNLGSKPILSRRGSTTSSTGGGGATPRNPPPSFSALTLQPHYLSPPPGLNLNTLSSSLRGIPSLFVARHNQLGSPRISVSSEGGTSETSEAPELELEDALDWIPKTGRGTKKPMGRRSKVQDIDWTKMNSGSAADALFSSAPSALLLEPVRLIRTQQPGPTPRMELPGRMRPP